MNRPASGWRWQDAAAGGGLMDDIHPTRRSGRGSHDVIVDGFGDLLHRAQGASVIDIACNRGHAAYEFLREGARLVHGCDINGPGIIGARQWFAEYSHVETKFEVVDLEKGPDAVTAAFGPDGYDIVLFLGVYHKLKRVMPPAKLEALVRHLAGRALAYFVWTGYGEDLPAMDALVKPSGLRRVHVSELTKPGNPAVIWKRT